MASSTARWREKTPRIEAVGRTFAYLLHEGSPRLHDLSDRRARHSARQSRALRRRQIAAGALWRRRARARDAGRRLRQPYRRDLCDGARPHPRLRSCQSRSGGQCGRHRRAHRLAQPRRARARSKTSCAASRKSKRRSSRASRNISSRPWRCRTKSTLSRIWRARWRCQPRATARGASANPVDAARLHEETSSQDCAALLCHEQA